MSAAVAEKAGHTALSELAVKHVDSGFSSCAFAILYRYYFTSCATELRAVFKRALLCVLLVLMSRQDAAY